ncbi:UNVERIFIED_CONTAM: hypothetical protein PYX00_003801 [Menopon gallinae]|uniref:Serpin domain-containing protein n=1 Tax=Menopon gallinae TaxID=328185 RepID=A0AAW2I1Q9_9NEOP
MSTIIDSCALIFLLALGLVNQIQCDEVYDQFLKSSRDFTIDFLKVASKDGGNALVSPPSVLMMLALLQQGARGNTEKELTAVLGSDSNSTQVSYRNFLKTLTQKSPGVTMEWGTRLYPKKGLTILPEFKTNIEENFGTQFDEIDYKEVPPAESAGRINSWISELTRGQITDLVEPHMVNPDAIMLMVNVMFFKGSWRNRFKEKNTKMADFETSRNQSVKTKFMYQKNRFYTGKNNTLGIKWIELPFEGDTHKMIFVLPTKRHTLKKAMNQLTGDDLERIIKYADLSEVRLQVPKFKLKRKYSLPKILETLGVKSIFTGESNLSGISPEPFYVTDAFHEANTEIDEKGATASAATLLVISRQLILTEVFRMNQPFLFFIVDNTHNLPLFAGMVVNPTVS